MAKNPILKHVDQDFTAQAIRWAQKINVIIW